MFLNKPKAVETKGYHVSDLMKLQALEGFLNTLPVCAVVIDILYTGVMCSVVYKI